MDKMEKLESSPNSNSAKSLVEMNRLNNLSDGVSRLLSLCWHSIFGYQKVF